MKNTINIMPTKMLNSSTPIKLNFDPVSKNTLNNCTMNYQKIYPGIYLTSAKDLCSANDLKILGFTHIIYIDKHVIESNDDELQNNSHCTGRTIKSSNTIKHNAQLNSTISTVIKNQNESDHLTSSTSSSLHCHEMPIDVDLSIGKMDNENIFGHNDFETLDLNFGESLYLTTVLPNCYKAVKFIEKALKNNGAVLVIDCIGGSQRCITIVIGFLMYKFDGLYLTAYQLIKRLHPNLELDKFFTTQLYEYEPILQVQRSQLAGNSCSRELRSALLKRKKTFDECDYGTAPSLLPHNSLVCDGAAHYINNMEQTTDILME